ncbi:MAG: hypothetical protein KC543_16570 [Myxococcales bacterium]|nr:hypothetical protein [Myxococcales bacterium]
MLFFMAVSVKFSSKMDAEVLDELRAFAAQNDRTLASVLNEAATEYLQRVGVRPAFRRAAARVLDEHAELLARLAK